VRYWTSSTTGGGGAVRVWYVVQFVSINLGVMLLMACRGSCKNKGSPYPTKFGGKLYPKGFGLAAGDSAALLANIANVSAFDRRSKG
jgi:hypothetical protein